MGRRSLRDLVPPYHELLTSIRVTEGAVIVKPVADFCWFLVKCSLLVGTVGLLVAIPKLLHRVDEEIRRQIERHLAEDNPGLKVSVRYAALVKGRGIEARGISFVNPGQGARRRVDARRGDVPALFDRPGGTAQGRS